MATLPNPVEMAPRIYHSEKQLRTNELWLNRYISNGLSPDQAEILLLKNQLKTCQVLVTVFAARLDALRKGVRYVDGETDYNDGTGTQMKCPVCAGTLTYKVRADGGINGVCLTPKCSCFSVSE